MFTVRVKQQPTGGKSKQRLKITNANIQNALIWIYGVDWGLPTSIVSRSAQLQGCSSCQVERQEDQMYANASCQNAQQRCDADGHARHDSLADLHPGNQYEQY